MTNNDVKEFLNELGINYTPVTPTIEEEENKGLLFSGKSFTENATEENISKETIGEELVVKNEEIHENKNSDVNNGFDLLYYIKNNNKKELEDKLNYLINNDQKEYNTSSKKVLDDLKNTLSRLTGDFGELLNILSFVKKIINHNIKDYYITGFNDIKFELDNYNLDSINELNNHNIALLNKYNEYISNFYSIFEPKDSKTEDEVLEDFKSSLLLKKEEVETDNTDSFVNDFSFEEIVPEVEEAIGESDFIKGEKLSIENVFSKVNSIDNVTTSSIETDNTDSFVNDFSFEEIVPESSNSFVEESNNDNNNDFTFQNTSNIVSEVEENFKQNDIVNIEGIFDESDFEDDNSENEEIEIKIS